MTPRIGRQVALVTVTAALTVATAQAPASASPQWQIDGSSYSGCASASGDYQYKRTGSHGGRDAYEAWWSLKVYRSSCDTTAHLQTRFDYWNASTGLWVDTGWKTGATAPGDYDSVGAHYRDVANVRFQVCDYRRRGQLCLRTSQLSVLACTARQDMQPVAVGSAKSRSVVGRSGPGRQGRGSVGQDWRGSRWRVRLVRPRSVRRGRGRRACG